MATPSLLAADGGPDLRELIADCPTRQGATVRTASGGAEPGACALRADGGRARATLAAAAGAAARAACCLAALWASPSAARAADRAVQLRVPPPVRPGVASMPLIAGAADDAERRINAALRRLDRNVRKAVAECRSYTGRPGTWQRRVDATMRGPGYLSLLITDGSFCDGAHPSAGVMAIVYDLRTGAPVDWTRLLPANLAGTVTLMQGGDGTRMVTLASARLHALYLAGYKAVNAEADDQDRCREAVAQEGASAPPAATAWLDAGQGGLGVQFGLPNVVQSCAAPVVIPAQTLREEGAGQLADAIDAAHRTRRP